MEYAKSHSFMLEVVSNYDEDITTEENVPKKLVLVIWEKLFNVMSISMILNLFYHLNYYLMIKNPFFPAQLRVKWYFAFTILVLFMDEFLEYIIDERFKPQISTELEPITWIVNLVLISLVFYKLN